MGHYAKVLEGKVIQVIVAEPDFFDSFVDSTPGEWVQTSYNTHGGEHLLGGTPLRYSFAGVGWNYDREADAFYSPQPFPSWTLNTENYLWTAPVVYPDDGQDYIWNEAERQWVLLQDAE